MTEHERQAVKDWFRGMSKEEKKIARRELGIKQRAAGQIRCHVCGKYFRPRKEERYTTEPTGIERLSGIGSKDAFDCPFCGCQNVVGDRRGKE